MVCNACGDKPEGCAGEHFPKPVVEINNPEQIVLFRKVSIPASLGDETTVPPAIGKYHNVLLHYEATGANYIYSSDGIPTLLETEVPQEIYNQLADLRTDVDQEVIDRENADTALQGSVTALDNSLATVAKSGDYTDLSNTPTIGDGTLTIKANGTTVGTFKANATTDTTASISFPEVDNTLSTSSSNAIANSAVSGAINKSVLTDIDLSSNTSTTTVNLEGAKENLYSGATSTKNVSFPVASSTQAGVMNSAIYDSITNNTNNINAVMNGAVAVSGLAASPAQSDLTAAWQSETGLSAIINRASIYDVTNQKVWTYYSNTSTWYAASNTSQVTVSPFTNLSAGTILGSQNIGQIFAENDGTGSVNGWDALSNAVSTNTSNIVTLQSAIPTVNNATLTIQNNGSNVATFTANSATNTTANIVPPVQIGSVLSTPTNVAYVDTANIIDGAVTVDKLSSPIDGVIDMEEGFTASLLTCKKIGHLVFWSMSLGRTETMGTGAVVTVGTMPSGFRPPEHAICHGSTTAGLPIYVLVTGSEGEIRVRPYESLAISESAYIGGTYYVN